MQPSFLPNIHDTGQIFTHENRGDWGRKSGREFSVELEKETQAGCTAEHGLLQLDDKFWFVYSEITELPDCD